MRRRLFQTHKYAALATGAFLAVIGLSGSLLAFEDEIAGWLSRDLLHIPRGPVQVPLAELTKIVRQTFPGEGIYGLRLGAEDRSTTIFMGSRQVFVNGHTGEVLGVRAANNPMRLLRKLHAGLLAPGGQFVVVLCAFTLTWLSGTGVVLWWRQRNARGTRETARATHDSIGIVSNVYLLALGISAICFILPIAPLVYWITGSKEPRRPPLSSVAVEGGSTISPDQVARVATGALPGLLPETVLFPASRTAAYRVGMRQGESTLLAGDVQIDQYSGKLLAAARINNSEPAMRIVQGIRSFHVGRWLGIPSQILAALAGLAIAAQALTGFLMWRNARRRVAARYREPAPEPAAQSLR